MSYGVPQFLRAAASQREFLRQQRERGTELLSQHDAGREDVAHQRAAAMEDLTATLLPSLTRENVAQAVQRTKYAVLRMNDPVAAMAAEAERLSRRAREIEADPQYRDRDRLRDPTVGELTLALAEVKEQRSPLVAFLKRIQHPRLERLIAAGYGTASYQTHWWQWAYYEDWKAGDEILERFSDHKEFGTLSASYQQVVQANEVYGERLRDVQGKLDRIAALETELSTIRQQQETLEERHLRAARESLATFLDGLPEETFASLFTGAGELEVMAKRVSGLSAKLKYLDEMKQNQLLPTLNKIDEQASKLQADSDRYRDPRRRNRVWEPEAFEKRFQDRSEWYDKYWNRYSRGYDTVIAFDDYHRARWTDDFLWWDLMTAGRLDGRQLPSVTVFRSEHPDYVFQRHVDDADDALAAAAIAAEDPADLPAVDVS